ncbi:uncharacterized protein LOC134697690 [Mytilus trossulus]|uniref:uncharacterized protein LOC134697690 n=1 Tax=Mytilus trossulus TaxID=6551 RepID=UPI0030053C75
MGNKTSNLDYITDKQLQYVANKLSTEWKDVAVSLGLRVGQIDQTMEEYSNESLSMIKTRVLQIWRNKVGRNPRNISTLLKALEDNGRRDIVESIKVKLDKQVDFGRIFDELQHRESPSIFSADSSVQGSLLEPERRLDLRPGPVSDNQVRYPEWFLFIFSDSRFEPESRLELRPELASENQNKHPGSRLESERRLDLRPETVSENQSRYPGSRLESERRLDLRPETVSENQSRYPGSRLEHERRLVLHPEYQSGYPGNFLEPERFFEHHAETVNVPEVPYRHPDGDKLDDSTMFRLNQNE